MADLGRSCPIVFGADIQLAAERVDFGTQGLGIAKTLGGQGGLGSELTFQRSERLSLRAPAIGFPLDNGELIPGGLFALSPKQLLRLGLAL